MELEFFEVVRSGITLRANDFLIDVEKKDDDDEKEENKKERFEKQKL